jgi:hypothetical protein
MSSDFEFIHIQNCLENKNLEKYRKKNGESKEKTKSMKRKTA